MKKNKMHGFLKAKKRLISIMRNLLLFISAGMSTCFANNSYAQAASFTMEYERVTLREVIREVEQQSDFIFFYLDNAIDLERKVSVRARNEGIETVLKQAFAGTDTRYYISDRQIILSKEATGPSPAPAQAGQQGRSLSGTVIDELGPVTGANVTVKGTANGTVTDIDGKFALSNLPDNAVVQISFIGYVTQEIAITTQTALNITLLADSKALEEVVVVGYGTVKKSRRAKSVPLASSISPGSFSGG